MVHAADPLRRYWHPVAEGREVAAGPLGVTLLGERIVLFRSAEGVRAFRDACVHRGARLSSGRVDGNGCLVCPYHGWSYDGGGRVVRIPSLRRTDAPIPTRAQATVYRATERHGLVWVALDEPLLPIADFPEYTDPAYRTFVSVNAPLATSAGRYTDNGLDISHFPFIHPGALGDNDDPVTPEYEIIATPVGFTYSYRRLEQAGHFSAARAAVTSVTQQHVPFTRRRVLTAPRGHSVQFITAQPIDDLRCRVFAVEAIDHSAEVPTDKFIAFTAALLEQDRAIVENQTPLYLDTDPGAELHMRVPDAVGLAYRRSLREAGIARA